MIGHPKDYQMSQKQGERQSNPINEVGCSALTFDSNQTGDTSPHQLRMEKGSNLLVCEPEREQQSQEAKKHRYLKESHGFTKCDGGNKEKQEQDSLSTEVYEESEMWISYGGAKNFFLGRKRI